MNYLKIDKCDYLNGAGVGVALWLSGCDHHCKGCQNPSSWDIRAGKAFDISTEEELIECLKLPYISHLTLTGGDPLYENNLEDVLNLVNKISLLFPEKNIWIYSGYSWNDISKEPKRKEIVSKCDVLVDGEYIDELRDVTLAYRGSSNQRIIDVKKSIAEGKIVLYEI